MSLPMDCLLPIDTDMYYEHELHKTISSRNGCHKCLYCNNRFKIEFYLDRDMDNMHTHLISADNHIYLTVLVSILGVSDHGVENPLSVIGGLKVISKTRKRNASSVESYIISAHT